MKKVKKLNKKPRKPLPQKVRDAASAALIGNTYHKLRIRSGVEPLFSDPFQLLKEVEEYFTWVDSKPLFKTEWKDGRLVGVPMKRPYSLEGLCTHLGVLVTWWRGFKESKTYKENKDFGSVMAVVEQRMFEQKFEGASSGFFNANLIARYLGLSEHTDHTTAGDKIEAPVFQIIKGNDALSEDEKSIDKERKKRE